MKNCFITESKVHLNKEVDVKQPAYVIKHAEAVVYKTN